MPFARASPSTSRAMTERNPGRVLTVVDLVTSVGLILSLVFVGLEVRQNTLAVKGGAIEALAAQSIEFVTAWSTDPVLPGLLGLARDGGLPQDLEPDELSRLQLAYITALRSYESRYLQYRLGILNETAFEMLAGNADFWKTPMFRAVWPGRSGSGWYGVRRLLHR